MHWIILSIGVLLNALANILMKAATQSLEGLSGAEFYRRMLGGPTLYLGVLSFGLALVAYVYALKNLPLGVAYPIMTSVGLMIIAGVSWYWFGEAYTTLKILGTGFIIVGVVLLTVR